jgi:hypothetical protein
MEGNNNTVLMFFSWWYSAEIASLLKFLGRFIAYLADLFSVKICLTTLLAPWKRDQISYEGLSIPQRFNVAVLNLVSRFVGFIIKIFTLVFYLITAFMALVTAGVILVIFLIYPVFIFALIYYGIMLLVQ